MMCSVCKHVYDGCAQCQHLSDYENNSADDDDDDNDDSKNDQYIDSDNSQQ